MKEFGYWKNLFSLKLPLEITKKFIKANERMFDLPTYQAELKRFPILNLFLHERPDNVFRANLKNGLDDFFGEEFQAYKPSLKEIIRTNPLFKDLDIIDRKGIIRNSFETPHIEKLLKKHPDIDKSVVEKLIHMEKLIRKNLIINRAQFLERLSLAYDKKKDGKASKEDLEFAKVYNGFYSEIQKVIRKMGSWEEVFPIKLSFEASRKYNRANENMLTIGIYKKVRKTHPILEAVLYYNPDVHFKDKGWITSYDYFGTIKVNGVVKKISDHIQTPSNRDLERTDKELEQEDLMLTSDLKEEKAELNSKNISDTKISKTSSKSDRKEKLSPSAKGLIEAIETFHIEGYTEHLARHPLNSYMNAKNKIEALLKFPEKGLDKIYTEYEMKKIKDAWEREQQKAFLLKEGIILN